MLLLYTHPDEGIAPKGRSYKCRLFATDGLAPA